MIIEVYSIKDVKSGIFQNPLCTTHLVELQRGLEHAVQKEGIPFNTHTADFELFKLGTFDNETGAFMQEQSPVHTLNLINLKPPTGE